MASIMVAEDEASVRSLIRAVLEGDGHSIVEAKDGAAALVEARARSPQLLILDISMPKALRWLGGCRRRPAPGGRTAFCVEGQQTGFLGKHEVPPV